MTTKQAAVSDARISNNTKQTLVDNIKVWIKVGSAPRNGDVIIRDKKDNGIIVATVCIREGLIVSITT